MNESDAEMFGKAMGELVAQEVGAVAKRVQALESAEHPDPNDLVELFAQALEKSFSDG